MYFHCDNLQVFLTCMNRARQMQQLSRQQLPRGGFWSATDSRLLRQLETVCLNPAAAAAPGLNPAATSSAGAAESPSQAEQAGGSSMSKSDNRGNAQEEERSGRHSNGSSRSRSSGRAVEGSSSSSSTSRRRAGNAVPASVASGRNASAVDGRAEDLAAYDEDGLRWASQYEPRPAAAHSEPASPMIHARVHTYAHVHLTHMFEMTFAC